MKQHQYFVTWQVYECLTHLPAHPFSTNPVGIQAFSTDTCSEHDPKKEQEENPKLCEAKIKHNRILNDEGEMSLGTGNLTLWIRRC